MKIDPPHPAQPAVSPSSAVAPAKPVGTGRTGTNAAASTTSTAAGETAGDASVNLSPLSSRLRDVQAQLAQPGPADIDTARVAQLQQAIREGRLNIDPGKIADGLLASARELLRPAS